MTKKRKTGTKEWADSNYNIGTGCAHDCRYCYARANALRFGQVPSSEDWTTERVRDKFSPITKKGGWIMFPTTHDITPFYLEPAAKVLKEMLSKGNKVLIVTKPHMTCIVRLCEELEEWKSNVLFRFTISGIEIRANFWEPGAPSISERLMCLGYAGGAGYATSVSMEPMLGTVEETLEMFKGMAPYVTDKIWIGKMNKVNNRVKKSNPDVAVRCEEVMKFQTDDKIMWLVNELKDNPKIEWKDSIKEVIEKYENI